MLTQVQLERRMYSFGRARANRVIDSNEEGGRASNNPYASVLYRRFVLPLAERIKRDLDNRTAGRNKAHVALLAPLDPEGVAFLTVRNTLNRLLNLNEGHRCRSVVTDVGKAAYHELLLRLFEDINPALFHTLTNDLDRRHSAQESHRIRTFKEGAKNAGIEFPEWGSAGVTQVGSYLVNQLVELGMIETYYSSARKRQNIEVRMAPDVNQLIETVREMVRETMPYFLPCIEPPKDWTAIDEGGWHTDEMRRMQPFAVASRGAWSEVQDQGISVPLRAMNTLQRVRWQVNSEMLDTVKQVSQHFDMDEVIGQAEYPAPPRPAFLDLVSKTEDMSAEQLQAFSTWKREKREWHTQIKLRSTKVGRFSTAMRVAEEYREYPAIFFN